MQQQHLDQRLRPGGGAMPGPRRGPEHLVHAGEHRGRPSLGQGRRTRRRAGLADHDLQVMIQLQGSASKIPGRFTRRSIAGPGRNVARRDRPGRRGVLDGLGWALQP